VVDSFPLFGQPKILSWLQHHLCYAKDAAPKTSHEVQKAQKVGADFEVVPGDPHAHH
jgi:hypothetical protein